MFLSIYALFNFYIWFIAYMYAPSLDFSTSVNKVKQPNISEAEKERQKIMNDFYMSEMKNDDDDEEKTGLTKSSSIGLKKSSKDKKVNNPY